jgi:gliding motility-associated-like protein
VTESVGNYEFQLDNGPFQDASFFPNVSPGLHTVTVNDLKGCGMITETITVVGFPKYFTPNGDGINDLWHIEGVETLSNAVVHVFDKYGKLLKQMEADYPGWDGTFNGMLLPSADYWFKLTYTDHNGLVVEARYIRNHFALKR